MSELYRRPIANTWWMKKPNYRFFMYRELTAVFVLIFLINFFMVFVEFGARTGNLQCVLQCLSSPLSLLFHTVVLIAACFHSSTWFNLVPKAIVVRKGEEKIPDAFLIAPHYVGWLTVSVIVFLIATWS